MAWWIGPAVRSGPWVPRLACRPCRGLRSRASPFPALLRLAVDSRPPARPFPMALSPPFFVDLPAFVVEFNKAIVLLLLLTCRPDRPFLVGPPPGLAPLRGALSADGRCHGPAPVETIGFY